MLSMAAFVIQKAKLSSCNRETALPAKAKIFTVWSFTERLLLIPDMEEDRRASYLVVIEPRAVIF